MDENPVTHAVTQGPFTCLDNSISLRHFCRECRENPNISVLRTKFSLLGRPASCASLVQPYPKRIEHICVMFIESNLVGLHDHQDKRLIVVLLKLLKATFSDLISEN